jgi:hypothetical protein
MLHRYLAGANRCSCSPQLLLPHWLIWHRSITNKSARRVLGIHHNDHLSPKELRLTYFEAAKRCHPDTSRAVKLSKEEVLAQFRDVTDAYEFLQDTHSDNTSASLSDLGITETEESQYRRACLEWLGVVAETVEESKKCSMFRDWLKGDTDAAERWRVFFILNGGMAPMLRPPVALIEDNAIHPPSTTRRKRR